jgi:hypothetical protein
VAIDYLTRTMREQPARDAGARKANPAVIVDAVIVLGEFDQHHRLKRSYPVNVQT